MLNYDHSMMFPCCTIWALNFVCWSIVCGQKMRGKKAGMMMTMTMWVHPCPEYDTQYCWALHRAPLLLSNRHQRSRHCRKYFQIVHSSHALFACIRAELIRLDALAQHNLPGVEWIWMSEHETRTDSRTNRALIFPRVRLPPSHPCLRWLRAEAPMWHSKTCSIDFWTKNWALAFALFVFAVCLCIDHSIFWASLCVHAHMHWLLCVFLGEHAWRTKMTNAIFNATALPHIW